MDVGEDNGDGMDVSILPTPNDPSNIRQSFEIWNNFSTSNLKNTIPARMVATGNPSISRASQTIQELHWYTSEDTRKDS